ncbi:MAG: DUF1311 domain-containing protein [Ferruginibacter sp.]|nr:DUF1311 domain-containing protein [Cytophagales bacterium]
MKKLLASTLLSLTLGFCFAQTQSAVNQTEYRNFQAADRELNSVYQKILREYASDPAFLKNLRTAQRIWVQFRDAEVKMKYPDRPAGHYGSVQPTCQSAYQTALTEQRTAALKIWLTGIGEGDVCAGSVRTKR